MLKWQSSCYPPPREHWAKPLIPTAALAPHGLALQGNVGKPLLYRANYRGDSGEHSYMVSKEAASLLEQKPAEEGATQPRVSCTHDGWENVSALEKKGLCKLGCSHLKHGPRSAPLLAFLATVEMYHLVTRAGTVTQLARENPPEKRFWAGRLLHQSGSAPL